MAGQRGQLTSGCDLLDGRFDDNEPEDTTGLGDEIFLGDCRLVAVVPSNTPM